ncbi:MAG TPA: right-handed parallel beta-helix repeat-containing protein [Kofleriaceae bacterium]|nr:right-handed parallel beta-helix repeat-containing protein [Kofleriaceae bacterium]
MLTRSTEGAIVSITGISDIKLERLEVFGARNGTNGVTGDGIWCAGPPKVEVLDVVSRSNAGDGFSGSGCTLTTRKSKFVENGGYGVENGEGMSYIDRCTVAQNVSTGLFLDGGVHVVKNSIVARNGGSGIDIYTVTNGSLVEFNTIVDNGDGIVGKGIECNGAMATWPNNIVVRNRPVQVQGSCSFVQSIVASTDIAPLKFKQPDAAPFDYHLMPGSIAIDMASDSSTKVDFDGEARPAGAANDIGADELH